MKLCIPTMGDRGMEEMVGEHFGRVPTYTLVDTETGDVKVVQNTTTPIAARAPGPKPSRRSNTCWSATITCA